MLENACDATKFLDLFVIFPPIRILHCLTLSNLAERIQKTLCHVSLQRQGFKSHASHHIICYAYYIKFFIIKLASK